MPKKDWMTGQSLYGELQGGFVFRCSIPLCKRLLQEESVILATLGQYLAFELAIGMNGLIWIDAKESAHIILAYNAILNAEHLTDAEAQCMIKQLVQKR